MSDFWIRKLRTYFRIFDLDQDGVIPRKDFQNIAERFCDQEKAHPVQKETARQRFNDLFSLYTIAAGTDNDVQLTESLFIESMKMLRVDPAALKKALSGLVLSLFAVMKLKHDGYLQPEEFRRYFQSSGVIDCGFTKEAFKAIDANHDGKLSFEEFMNSCNDYLFSDEENTEAMFGLLF